MILTEVFTRPAIPPAGPLRRWCLALLLASLLIWPACDGFHLRPPRMEVAHDEGEFHDAKLLRVKAHLSVGEFRLDRAAGNQLYQLDMRWDAANMSRDIQCREFGDVRQLEIRLEGSTVGDQDISTYLSLTHQLPLDLDLKTGASESRLILSEMNIEDLSLEQGVGETKVMVDQSPPAPCHECSIVCGVGKMELQGLGYLAPRQFRFKGGVGETLIDFSGEGGQDITGVVEVGIGRVEIKLPAEMGVRLSTNKGLGNLSLPSGHFNRQGSGYETPGYDSARQKLDLEIRTGIGETCIRITS